MKHKLNQRLNTVAFWIARHLPKRIRYWVYVDIGVNHIHDDEIVPEVLYTDILARMEK